MTGFFSSLFKHDTRPQKAILEKVDRSRQELTETRGRLEDTIADFLNENDRLRKRTQNVPKPRS